MLLSPQTPEEGSTYIGTLCHMQIGFSICRESFGLMQLDSCRPSKDHHRTPATSPKQRYVWCVVGPVIMPPNLCELHWLSIQFFIAYNLCLMMHSVHIGCSPSYIKEILTPTAELIRQHQLRTTRATPQGWSEPSCMSALSPGTVYYMNYDIYHTLPSLKRVSRHI